MKKIMLPLSVYLIVCLLATLLPASDGYDTIVWKLILAQVYAIPASITAILLSFLFAKKHLKD